MDQKSKRDKKKLEKLNKKVKPYEGWGFIAVRFLSFSQMPLRNVSPSSAVEIAISYPDNVEVEGVSEWHLTHFPIQNVSQMPLRNIFLFDVTVIGYAISIRLDRLDGKMFFSGILTKIDLNLESKY